MVDIGRGNVRNAQFSTIHAPRSMGRFGLEAIHRCAGYEGPLWAESSYSNSTASLNCSAFTSI